MLKKYIRDSKRNPIGVLIGVLDETGRLRIGWSLCSRYDVFDKHIGMQIAVNRLFNDRTELPDSIVPDFCDFYLRCVKYFKLVMVQC